MYLFGFIILLLVFFPYISIIDFGTDVQPLALTFGIVFFGLSLYRKRELERNFIYPFIVMFFSIVIFLFSGDYFEGIRSSLGYMSLFFIPVVVFSIIKKSPELFIKILKISTFVYFFVAIIQRVFDKFFLSNLLTRMSTSEERGVTSLTPEPTFYGITLLFLLLIFYSLELKKGLIYQFFIVFQIVFLAQSSMAVLYLLVFFFSILFFRLKILNRIFLIGLIVLFFSIFKFTKFQNLDNLRMVTLLNMFIDNPWKIISLDASINDRVSAIYFSFKGFFSNFFLPNGFGYYASFLTNELPTSVSFWWVSVSNRIMSFYGSCLFELGGIGLLIPFFVNKCIYDAHKTDRKKLYVILTTVNLLLLSAIPLSFTLVGVYMAVLLYKKYYLNINYEKTTSNKFSN